MAKLRNGSKGMIRTRLSRLRARHSTSELPRSKRIIDRTLREETGSSVSCRADGQRALSGSSIFTVMQVVEAPCEIRKELHMVFIDLEKAYYIVPRQEESILCLKTICASSMTRMKMQEHLSQYQCSRKRHSDVQY